MKTNSPTSSSVIPQKKKTTSPSPFPARSLRRLAPRRTPPHPPRLLRLRPLPTQRVATRHRRRRPKPHPGGKGAALGDVFPTPNRARDERSSCIPPAPPRVPPSASPPSCAAPRKGSCIFHLSNWEELLDSITGSTVYYPQERWKSSTAGSILNLIAATADEYQGIMKAPQQHCKSTDTEANVKLGVNKMHCLKPGKYTHESPGNVGAKCRTGDGQSFTGSKISLKGGSSMEVPFLNLTNASAQPPNYSGKMKLQFFPIDEAIQKVLQQEKHNPYLELTLAPRKKMSSIVQHLNTKWGRSSCAKGDLMLFPYSARPDSIASSKKWTINDSCTAADVYVAVGSPSTFRLRYGWFNHNMKQQISKTSLAPALSAEKTMGDKPSDPFKFPSKFVSPSVECNTEQNVVDNNQSKVAPLSWMDCISNISFGALLSQAVPSQDSKQAPLQQNSSNFQQQIPATCDSFDAAIASLIARQQTSNQPKVSNPSPWEADETCHAFPPPRNQNLARMSSCGPGNSSAITSTILGAIAESGADGDRQHWLPALYRRQERGTKAPSDTTRLGQ